MGRFGNLYEIEIKANLTSAMQMGDGLVGQEVAKQQTRLRIDRQRLTAELLQVVMVVVDVMAQEKPDVGAVISKRIIVINETEFIESEPIIETITEHFVIVTPNEDPAPAPVEVSASWGSVAPAVARWQPHINQAIAHCALRMPGYDAALLMAAIVTSPKKLALSQVVTLTQWGQPTTQG